VPIIRMEINGNPRAVVYEEGRCLRHILESHGLVVRTGCNGNGTCGLCTVKVIGAERIPFTQNEMVSMSEERVAKGYRLACQFVPRGNIEVALPRPPGNEGWRSLDLDPNTLERERTYRLEGSGYGIAVDLGTTNIRISLVDLSNGQRLRGLSGTNPQSVFGLDIMSRLVSIRDEPGRAKAIRESITGALEQAINRLCSSNGLDTSQIDRVRVVGNSAMLLILGADDPLCLLDPKGWSRKYGMAEHQEVRHCPQINIGEKTELRITPPLAGFVGSDLTADVVSTGLMNDPGPNLLIDFGTNNEMCLYDGKNAFITACAGGPALEGVGIGCCTPPDWGTASRAVPLEDGSFDLTVIGEGVANGLSGPALIDVLAEMVRSGALDSKGNFTDGRTSRPITNDGRFIVTKADVDKIMRAKSAVASGWLVLLNRAGLRPDSLKKIFITGNFGRYLNVESAQRIGLLPFLPSSRFMVMDEASLIGCEDMLVSTEAMEVASSFRRLSEPVDLVREPGFDDLFLENLYLQPIRAAAVAEDIGLDQYINASQYLAGINSPEPEAEMSKALLKFMGADLIGLALRNADHGIIVTGSDRDELRGFPSLWTSDLQAACHEVFESGFLNSLEIDGQDLQVMLIPVNIERQVTHVLIVGYRRENVIDRQKMNIYLSIASLIGTQLQRVRNEEELRRHRTDLVKLVEDKLEELRRSNAELQQFAYIASHDLQEPLRMVTASLGRLEKKYIDKLDGEAQQYMNMAVEGASRMRALINDLLAYSRVESGGKEFTEVDMNIALSNSLNNLDPMIVANHVEIDADHLPTVSADETQMTQVLQNLVSNAVKYHGPDPPDIRIRTVLSPNGAEWTFSVSDNGIGIDPLYQEKIFQMFQRLHTRDEYEGTGIGLAITKRIIERHGGKIWVESEEGRGSTFFFTIPRRNAEQG
jgi:uncharacterized 2Fe-2S/4Fe-4S cluster protein (DUF4445 family)/signal transduction histidine kinase